MASEELQELIRRAELLPPDEQLLLIARLAEATRRAYHISARQGTLDHTLGLLASDQPMPSDAEVEQWLDDQREEKHC